MAVPNQPGMPAITMDGTSLASKLLTVEQWVRQQGPGGLKWMVPVETIDLQVVVFPKFVNTKGAKGAMFAASLFRPATKGSQGKVLEVNGLKSRTPRQAATL